MYVYLWQGTKRQGPCVCYHVFTRHVTSKLLSRPPNSNIFDPRSLLLVRTHFQVTFTLISQSQPFSVSTIKGQSKADPFYNQEFMIVHDLVVGRVRSFRNELRRTYHFQPLRSVPL